MKTIFFNSSMPRAGSTLLQNILGNNPDMYASPTSPFFELINSSKQVYTKSPVMKAQNEKEMKSAFLNFCRYGLHGYYDALTDRKYVIDKCRGWNVNKAFLESFYPNPKIICMVRDLRDIVASMEKNYRKHIDKWDLADDLENPKNVSVAQRVTTWMDTNARPVGDTLNKLKESIFRGYGEDILFIKFEDLCSNPKEIMQEVHEYLEIPYYEYDFNNIKQVTHEDDKFHGKYGDHKINSKIVPTESKSIELLGNIICKELYQRNKWYFDYFEYKF